MVMNIPIWAYWLATVGVFGCGVVAGYNLAKIPWRRLRPRDRRLPWERDTWF
jgi:hypothetical protein